jgi:glycerophosphoryl diester phosphodiesterase
LLAVTAVVACCLLPPLACAQGYSEYRNTNIAAQLGPRPTFLVDQLVDGDLKDTCVPAARACFARTPSPSAIAAPACSSRSTRWSPTSRAARQGAGIIECDVTFTKDGELVCRHSQCDLHDHRHRDHPELNAKCTQPFQPATFDAERQPGDPRRATAAPATSRWPSSAP